MGCGVGKATYCYSVPVSGTQKEGQTPIFTHPLARPYLSSTLYTGAKTLYQNFKASVDKYGSRPFLGTRILNPNGSLGDYKWKTYSDVYELVSLVGSGLSSIGLLNKDEIGLSYLGIFSKTRSE